MAPFPRSPMRERSSVFFVFMHFIASNIRAIGIGARNRGSLQLLRILSPQSSGASISRSSVLPTCYPARKMSSAAGKRLAGKTVLITGASSGIGRSTALEFARTTSADLRLIVTARRLESLRELAAQITKEAGAGVKVLPVQLDVSKANEVHRFVENLPEEWRDIHVLVNNA